MNNFLSWIVSTSLFTGIRSKVYRIVVRLIEAKRGCVVMLDGSYRADKLDFVRTVKRDTRTLMLDVEAYQIDAIARAASKIDGAVAEVGVYRGGSARIIATRLPNKTIHLFDTFEGLPEVEDVDARRFSKGQYAVTLDTVKENLKDFANINFYKGLFPQTAQPVSDERFALVNLDVDLYEGTKSSLEFFYSRMNKGGLIVSHDYSTAEGVRKAIDDFFADKQEVVVELVGSQCVIVKQ